MSADADVPERVLVRLRAVCSGLPEAVEEPAWVGVRWRIRRRTFAHVLAIESGWPPAYAKAAGTNGPACVLMFRSAGVELGVLREAGAPYFAPPWRHDEVGIAIDAQTVWDEVAELVVESYCVLAPIKLSHLVQRPSSAQ
jgi:hypothetical protein